MGVTAVWHAVTGPFAGMAGSALYVVSEGGKRMAGFFCNANNTSGVREAFGSVIGPCGPANTVRQSDECRRL